MAGLESWLD